jgi:hypothetical protein
MGSSDRKRDIPLLSAEESHSSPVTGGDLSRSGFPAWPHWPYCQTAVLAGAGIRRGHIHGKSDKTGSAAVSDAVHPGELLATIYHSFGIDPATIVYNHLHQPRELVKAEALTALFT